MSGYINYFENRSKNLSFMAKDTNVLDKYNEIWDKIKNNLSIQFHSMPVCDETYIKSKVREFDGKIKTNFLGNEIPKENLHYTCIACITTDSVVIIEKKNNPQVYLEECKYKMQMSKFINTELEWESESDIKLLGKLESNSDSDTE